MMDRIGRRVTVIFVFFLFLTSCNDGKLFQKLDPTDSGITFENSLTPTEDFNIIDYLYFYNGGGLAIGDINGDEYPDLFFSGNQVKNKLFLNKGGLRFEDISKTAGVEGKSTWNTGSVMGDVNGDGLLDIYVCAVVGLKNLKGHNELFINNGNNTFTERAEEYGLDFETYSSTASFLDYDMDGDLDMYLLNHAVHTPESFGNASLRNVRRYETGDKLLRNDGGKFVDVSEEAKIFGGINGYGLGISIADFNLDGYPDIYVSNDFHEDDYLYMNNRDGTFSEQLRKSFTQISRFSMGNDVSDINHDGYPDLISLDMLPEDEVVLKRSEGDENIQTLKLRTDQYGYYYQFGRNMLQINQGNGTFAEIGLMSNIAATDWSWSALFADFDQDGNQDLFVSNGIPHRPNDLDYIKFVSSEQIVNKMGVTKLADNKAFSLMPSGIIENYIFKGSGNYSFEDKSKTWLSAEKSCSTATAFGDLDNDGDLDIVINNVDSKPSIYINKANEFSNYLKIKLNYSKENEFGIGSRVFVYKNNVLQYKELYAVRGFQASSEPLLHFGFGNEGIVDSIVIVWPNGSAERLSQVKTNQTLRISYNQKSISKYKTSTKHNDPIFESVDAKLLGINFKHKEDNYTDFDRLKLLPYQQSDKGPATAVGDLNNDGKQDIFFGGSKRIPSCFFMQTDTGFKQTFIPSIQNDSIKEDVDAVIEDFNQDGKNDLFIGTGGADFYNKSRPLLDSYFKTTGDSFSLIEIANYYENASCVKSFDFDGDGDKDLFVGNESVSNDFGKIPKSYLLRNDKGMFTPVQQDLFDNIGMVTDAIWDDYNKDGQEDLIIVGEWMEPLFLKNEKGIFTKQSVLTEKMHGLWQSIIEFDVDGDGDHDYLLGNWGLNSKFKASRDYPMKMYYNDFDANGQSETIIAIEKNRNYYPFDSFDMLAGQIVSLRKKFTSYESFAGKTINEIFTEDQLNTSVVFTVDLLASGYLKNENGKFKFIQFPDDLQFSPILALIKYDFDADGQEEVLLGGNYFGVQPFNGRYGSFGGALFKNENSILLGKSIGLNLMNQSVKHFNIIDFNSHKFLLATINDGDAQVYKLLQR